MATVSVIIVSWNAAQLLDACLSSLRSEAAEVVVVDNASTDGSADVAARYDPGVRLLRQVRNEGFAGGVNAGVGAATGDHLLLLNPDAEAMPGAVAQLSRFLDEHPDAAAAAGRLVDADGRPQLGWNVRRLPALWNLVSELLLVDRLWPRNPWRRRWLALDFDATVCSEVEQPAAACLMVRRSVFQRLGGLDDRYFPAWFEDVDFCRRLRTAGGRIWFCPDAVFRHRGGVARELLGRAAFSQAWQHNLERYVRTHHGRGALLLVKCATAIGMTMRVAACIASRDNEGARAYSAVIRGSLFGWPGAGPEQPGNS